MSATFPPRLPSQPVATPSSPATGPLQPRGATIQPSHSDLTSRAQGQAGAGASLAPRNQIGFSTPGHQETRGPLPTIESMTHAILNRPIQATAAALQRLGEALASPFMPSQSFQATAPAVHRPAGPLPPYVAPSVAGYQTVPLAQMEPADARAALLAMDISPQFLDAMKAHLQHCTNPLSPGWRPESTQQFVATYGHLVAMPNGLDANTVGALKRMLASPEPSTPQAARHQQALPVSNMAPEDACAALRAMEVPPQVLAAMKHDVLACVETAGSVEGQQRAQQFRQDYGHLLALPQPMNAGTLTDLVNLVMDLDHPEPQAAAQAARQREIPPSETRPIALGTMAPAAALNALNLQEAELRTMMEHLECLINAESEEEGAADGGHEYNRLEGQFMQNYGHLFDLPARLDLGNRIALGELLDEYVQRMQGSQQD